MDSDVTNWNFATMGGVKTWLDCCTCAEAIDNAAFCQITLNTCFFVAAAFCQLTDVYICISMCRCCEKFYQVDVQSSNTHTHNHFMALLTLSGTTWASQYQKVHFAIFWIFWSKMKITQAELADAPTILMDGYPIQTSWCPHLCHPHHFYARCASLHSPPNLVKLLQYN